MRRPRALSPMGAFLVMAAAVLTSIALFFAVGHFLPDIVIPLPGSKQPLFTIKTPKAPTDMVVLVMGVDVPYANGRPQREQFSGARTDSMMLVRVSPGKNTVSAISIPRDSKVLIPNGHGIDKINAAYAYGGASLAVAAVESSFGVPVDRYLVVNTQGVRDLVDAIGGVTVVVEKPMHYRDQTARLNIQLEPGPRALNGEQAEGFVRFRHDALGDIGRIRRQQQFLSAVAAKLKNPWMVAKLPDLARFAGRYLDTNLSSHELLQLAWFSKDMDMSRVRLSTMPGTPTNSRYASYWEINAVEAGRVLDRLILDNPMAQNDMTSSRPLSVGLVYDPAQAQAIEPLVKRLEGKLFQVVCREKRASQLSQIIERSRRVNDESSARLRGVDPALGRAGLIFSPIGATFESNQCSMGEDYTVILGVDAAPRHNP